MRLGQLRCHVVFRLLLLFLVWHSVAPEQCLSPNKFRTASVTLSKRVNPKLMDSFPKYAAVDVTVHPTDSLVSEIFTFLPAAYWIRTTSEPCTNQSLNSTHIEGTIRLAKDFVDLRSEGHHALPDLSLWGDRSVLLLTVKKLSFKADGHVCPKTNFCPITGLITKSFLSSLTKPVQICEYPVTAASCMADYHSSLHFLYPLAHGLWVTIHGLGEKPGQFNNSLQFTLTAAYRLDVGEFRCPSGLFACQLPYDNVQIEPIPDLTWPIRLCLPLSLRCDGVPNCPNGGSDEQHCDRSYKTGFATNPDEQGKLQTWLFGFSYHALHSVGRDPDLLFAGAMDYRILWIGLGVLTLVVLILVVLIIFVIIPVYRSSRQQGSPSTKANGDGKCYEQVPEDLAELC